MTVGLVGLGLLGHAVARRLLAAGHRVVGFDLVPSRIGELSAIGGEGAASIRDVADASEAICTVLPSLASVEEVILGPDGLLSTGRPGQAIFQMSTISPALTERLAGEVGARRREFLDCPISGTSAMVARGDGVVLVGGEAALFDRWRPLLEAVLPRAVRVGAPGLALKLVANLLIALHSAAAAEALSLARAAGLDLDVALNVLGGSAAASRMLDVRGPLIARGNFPAQMKLDLFMKDLHLIQDAARAAGAPLPLTDVAERLYASAQAAGHGEEDLAVVVTALGAAR